jgi:hypothetical protein
MSQLDTRKISTILAALRFWQANTQPVPPMIYDIATSDCTVTPLSADEIDDLCEELNCEPEPPPFTPGPWKAECFAVESPAGHLIAHTGFVGNRLPPTTNEANARLIAEAPTLYALGQQLLAYKPDQFDGDEDVDSHALVSWFTDFRDRVHSSVRRIEGKAVRS